MDSSPDRDSGQVVLSPLSVHFVHFPQLVRLLYLPLRVHHLQPYYGSLCSIFSLYSLYLLYSIFSLRNLTACSGNVQSSAGVHCMRIFTYADCMQPRPVETLDGSCCHLQSHYDNTGSLGVHACLSILTCVFYVRSCFEPIVCIVLE